MNEKMEKQLAVHMIYHKEHGYSVLYVLRKSLVRYLGLFALLALCVILYRTGFLLGNWFIFVTGLLAGAVASDAGWIRKSKRVWVLYEKVIDWTKVKEIADKKAANQKIDRTGEPPVRSS
jgi:hypothetical protein